MFRKMYMCIMIVAALGFFLGLTASADTLYWDGTGALPKWGTASNWSTDPNATTPDPSAAPGASDIAFFNISTVTTQQLVDMETSPSVQGLVFNQKGDRVLIRGNGTNRTLYLGASGITVNSSVTASTAYTEVGSTAGGYNVAISLQGAQTWSCDTTLTGNNLRITNTVSIGAGGAQTLTLAGASDYSAINAVVSDGADVLSINKTGTGRWSLANANSYTGTTTVSQGVLYVTNGGGLGSTNVGTTVLDGGELLMGASIGNEPLTLNGSGVNTTFGKGALRCSTGSISYAGPITLGSDAQIGAVNTSTLTISNSITGTDTTLFVGGNNAGTVTINGAVSLGAGGLTADGPGSTVNVTNSFSYTGDTRVEQGTLRIDHSYLADASDVYLTTGAVFNLNFSGIDDVGGLYLDNLLQAAGTYGAVGTGADFESGFFAGTGMLRCVPEPGTLALLAMGLCGLLAYAWRRQK